MNELRNYVDQLNLWKFSPLGDKCHIVHEIDTHNGRQRVAGCIDLALSPENLSCDGELPIKVINARYRMLTAAARQLIKLDSSVKFCEYME
jgi:hypothetical protein